MSDIFFPRLTVPLRKIVVEALSKFHLQLISFELSKEILNCLVYIVVIMNNRYKCEHRIF